MLSGVWQRINSVFQYQEAFRFQMQPESQKPFLLFGPMYSKEGVYRKEKPC